MKQVIVFPTGTLNPKDKGRLAKAGVLAIEAPDPSKVVMLFPASPVLTGDMLTASALRAVQCAYDSTKVKFTHELIERIQAAEKAARTL